MYHGPVSGCAGYFEQFGFKCPEQVDITTFRTLATLYHNVSQIENTRPHRFAYYAH